MKLEWDDDKAAKNLKNHQVSFEDAALVFYDLGRVESYDDQGDHSEDRWETTGLANGSIVFVVYTVRENETIRLISARKAVSYEQKQYRKNNP